MRMGVIGINHKLAALKLREQLAKTSQKQFGFFQPIHENHSFILLSTCNRTEVYFSSEDLAATHSYLLSMLRSDVHEEFEHKLYSYFGIDCFCHLARVTAGLDSAVIAETEIQGQVKLAYEYAAEHRALPQEIHFLFQKSLNIGKKVRSSLQLGRGMPSLEHAIFQIGRDVFKKPKEARVLFVGASQINKKILKFLQSKQFSQITICNRSNDQALNIAQAYQANYLSWNRLHEWAEYDWVIFGTKSSDYLVSNRQMNEKKVGQKLIMDLCVPRNVDPKLGQYAEITLLNIDQINSLLQLRHRKMNQTLIEAEAHVIQAVQDHISRYIKKSHQAHSVQSFAV